YVSAVISEYGTGRNNYQMGICPPLSGHMRNENRESNGAWIRTEIWACLCAGNPALAANYAYYDACVDHSGEGIYAAVFTAAVQSAAFFERDVRKLIEIGLSYLPETCGVRNAVNVVSESFKCGDDWKTARKKLLIAEPSSFGEIGGEWKGTAQVPAGKQCPVQEKDGDIPKAVHGYDAPASIGIVLIGWLYGGGDFGKSVCIAANCGEDTDCTAGTLGAILGILGGASGIPDKWKNGCSEKIAICTLRPDLLLNVPETVSDLCERVVKQFPAVSAERCTFTEEGFELTAAGSLIYDENTFYPYQQENFKELLAESPHTVRFHFPSLTVKVKYDGALAKIEEGVEKRITLTLCNKLYLPQYLTVRILDMPEEWNLINGIYRAVGLEHWHGSKVSHTNSFDMVFTPTALKQDRYRLALEISVNGRGERYFVPVTLINGAC
ncbi:MAG: ADP-ribosylglycohydrolase family protein, partial [Clostridia bacterium]|nr:ADP-ribosylglycohydrolase family protein [Clostridia bacterium]